MVVHTAALAVFEECGILLRTFAIKKTIAQIPIWISTEVQPKLLLNPIIVGIAHNDWIRIANCFNMHPYLMANSRAYLHYSI